MKLKFLGTRGEEEKFTSTHKKHSGILVDNVLFDVGEPEYLEKKPKAIVVSHAHPDHFALEKAYDIDLYGPKEVIEKARKLGWKEQFLHLIEAE